MSRPTDTAPSLGPLWAALAEAMAEFQPIERNATGQTERGEEFTYADLFELQRKTRPALAARGLLIVQPISGDGADYVLKTVLVHAPSGASISSHLTLPPQWASAGLQDFGTAVKFLRRYAYASLLGLDDGDRDMPPGSTQSPVQPAIHPALRDAKSITELARVMRALPPAERSRFNTYFETRQAELKAEKKDPKE